MVLHTLCFCANKPQQKQNIIRVQIREQSQIKSIKGYDEGHKEMPCPNHSL